MKKTIAMMMTLLLMAACAVPVFAASRYEGAVPVNSSSSTVGSALDFTKRDFYGGQTLAVYYGPGVEYGRGANGWAKCSTDDTVYAAGKENGWALVMYGTSGGSVRVGWVVFPSSSTTPTGSSSRKSSLSTGEPRSTRTAS